MFYIAKPSTTLKKTEKTALNTVGELILGDEIKIETEDFGTLSLQHLLADFNGKVVKIAVVEQSDEELDVV